ATRHFTCPRLRSQSEDAVEREPVRRWPSPQPMSQRIRLTQELGLLELSRRRILSVRLDQFPGDVRLIREDQEGPDVSSADGPAQFPEVSGEDLLEEAIAYPRHRFRDLLWGRVSLACQLR